MPTTSPKIQTYSVSGMTCGGCSAKVTEALLKVPGIHHAQVSHEKNEAVITKDAEVPITEIRTAIREAGPYELLDHPAPERTTTSSSAVTPPSKWKRLYPLLLIFLFLIGGTILHQFSLPDWDALAAMRSFMGGFFVVFSFFKFLDLRAFTNAFQMYDPLSRLIPGYAWFYPFLELGLGISFLMNWNLFWSSLITLVVISIGTIGVARSVLNKREIQCACLGTVFNLPMTTVTLVENSLMILMSLMLLQLV
jgi:copper chaperone CopZ